MEKINLCLFFGGQSPEHEVSLISATQVLNGLDKNKYNIYPVGITKSGKWLLHTGSYEKIANGDWEKEGKPCFLSERTLILSDNFEKIPVHVGFPMIHGETGEDGSIVGLLIMHQIPYCGAGVAASACGLDKALSKLVFESAGIPQVPYKVFKIFTERDATNAAKEAETAFGYPMVIKPASTGSSIGINKVKNKEELILSIKEASSFGVKIIAEKFVPCREIEVSILGNEQPEASVCGEVLANTEFNDYDSKYKNDKLKICIPAPIDEEVSHRIREMAKRAYTALECRGFARADFFINKENNELYINEINTIPGFTSVSMYPMLWKHMGMSFSEILDKIIEFATK